MLRICSRKVCLVIAVAAVMGGSALMLNRHDDRRVEEPAPEPVAMSSEAVVDAQHEMHDAEKLRTAVRGIVLKAALGTTRLKTVRTERGIASSYGHDFNGRKTANGEIYNQNSYTAAHKKLPFGTKVIVKNLRNGREVMLRINNRGPFVKGRIIDVSLKAAKDLGMLKAGVVPVEVTVVADGSRTFQASQ